MEDCFCVLREVMAVLSCSLSDLRTDSRVRFFLVGFSGGAASGCCFLFFGFGFFLGLVCEGWDCVFCVGGGVAFALEVFF